MGVTYRSPQISTLVGAYENLYYYGGSESRPQQISFVFYSLNRRDTKNNTDGVSADPQTSTSVLFTLAHRFGLLYRLAIDSRQTKGPNCAKHLTERLSGV